MYPAGELNLLAARKALLRVRIAERRADCVVAAVEIARPLALVDRGIALWGKISPVVKAAGIPLALMLGRKFFGRHRHLSKLVALLPVLFTAARGMAPRETASGP